MRPRTQYVKGPEDHVAYQVFGRGPRDIVFVPDHPNNIEIMWEEPTLSRFLERLATMGRVICFDKRGTGISDPVPLGAIPTIERWMDDITTVIDEVGCKRVVVFGHGDGGPIAMLFAATYPERTEALVLGHTFAHMRRAADYPEGLSEVDADRKGTQLCEFWGREDRPRPNDPARRGAFFDPSFLTWRARFERLSLGPGAPRTMYPARRSSSVAACESSLFGWRVYFAIVRRPTASHDVSTFHREGLFNFYCSMHQPDLSGQILVLAPKTR